MIVCLLSLMADSDSGCRGCDPLQYGYSKAQLIWEVVAGLSSSMTVVIYITIHTHTHTISNTHTHTHT